MNETELTVFACRHVDTFHNCKSLCAEILALEGYICDGQTDASPSCVTFPKDRDDDGPFNEDHPPICDVSENDIGNHWVL